ncbi:hypothetical protein P280DRAFT_505194 [Massarina eburnea CBS 473.64]|uniref:Uncharacterized protein n=1 Tax=Massarina eburnea CBS 473.64 TaxID=1395130 RepID=A0A6A6S4U5_9PLEO|nr:hypothetical protein P280DRAFT_505194 [Massarina eburnea CBS 473.64]
MPFSRLPTELRQNIISEVLATPLSPPAINTADIAPRPPSPVQRADWFFLPEQLELSGRTVTFNVERVWGHPYLGLLLVDKAFKQDTEAVLKINGHHLEPRLYIMAKAYRDWNATWLQLPLPGKEAEDLHITIDLVDHHRVDDLNDSLISKSAKRAMNRLLRRITRVGFNPHSKSLLDTRIRFQNIHINYLTDRSKPYEFDIIDVTPTKKVFSTMTLDGNLDTDTYTNYSMYAENILVSVDGGDDILMNWEGSRKFIIQL